MPESLDVIRKQVRDRMNELAPLVEEFRQLEQASAALDGGAASAQTPRAGGGRRGRGGGSGQARAGAGNGSEAPRRGRKPGSGTRAGEALKLVEDRPGITIPELAEAMGIKQNYLYRVMPTLAGEGKVVKSGRGWHLKKD
jgi:hypothetical protein